MLRLSEIAMMTGALGLLLGCGQGAEPVETRAGVASSSTSADAAEWVLAVRNYPYLGPSGRMVCELRTRQAADGEPDFDAEEYDFNLMNDMLGGRADMEPELVARMRDAGIAQVATCDDARSFTALRNEFANERAAAEAPLPGVRSAPAPEPDSASDQEDKVAISHTAFHGYSVRVHVAGSTTCSGVLIAPNALLTAQHCVGTAANQFAYVDYGLQNLGCVSYGCSSHPPSSWASSPPPANARVYRFPGWTGTSDTVHDLALVINQSNGIPINWTPPADVESSWMRIYRDTELYGDLFWILGYGYNGNGNVGAGNSWQSNYEVAIESDHPEGSGMFTATVVSNGTRECHGDSGGPAINHRLMGMDLLFGLNSGASVAVDTSCPPPGDTEYWTAMWGKASFIETQLAAFDAVLGGLIHGPPCKEVSVSGKGAYVQCW